MPLRERRVRIIGYVGFACLAVVVRRSLPTLFLPGPCREPELSRREACQAAAVAASTTLALRGSSANAKVLYSETDSIGDVWTPRSSLQRRRPPKSLPRAFITYLARVLLNYDTRSIRFWERPAAAEVGENSVKSSAAEARRAQFAAFAEAVDLGIISAYGVEPSGLRGLATALRGLCRNDTSAKRQLAFTLSLLPPALQPVKEIGALVSDVMEVDGGQNVDQRVAASATDAQLQRFPTKSVARRLTELIPEELALPEWDARRQCYRPTDSALVSAAAISAMEANIDGGEGFGVGRFAASALPSAERPELLDPLFGPLGRSPVARARELGIQQFVLLALSGAASTSLVRVVLQPLDVVKTTLQLKAEVENNTDLGARTNAGQSNRADPIAEVWDATSKLVSTEGPSALYKGTDSTLVLTSVVGFSSFGLNEVFRRTFENLMGSAADQSNPYIVLFSALCATLVIAPVQCPLEIIRVRAMEPAEVRSFVALCSEALANGTEKLWAGLGVLNARELPFVACKFVVFDVASRALFEAFPDAAEDGLSSKAVYASAGFIAGLVASVASHPPDVFLTRIADGAEAEPVRRDFPLKAGARLAVWLRGGGAERSVDVWRGLGSRSIYFAATICAQFLIYTTVKEALGVGADDLSLVLDVFGISTKAESLLDGTS